MKNETYRPVVERAELAEFANFYVKYLSGSASQNEAFIRAKYTYRKLFKKIPFNNFQSFLVEFKSLQHFN